MNAGSSSMTRDQTYAPYPEALTTEPPWKSFFIFLSIKTCNPDRKNCLVVPLQTSCSLSGFNPLEDGSAPYFIGSEE